MLPKNSHHHPYTSATSHSGSWHRLPRLPSSFRKVDYRANKTRCPEKSARAARLDILLFSTWVPLQLWNEGAFIIAHFSLRSSCGTAVPGCVLCRPNQSKSSYSKNGKGISENPRNP